jgi:hypothetical protein
MDRQGNIIDALLELSLSNAAENCYVGFTVE